MGINLPVQLIGALQFLQFSTPYLAVTWQSKGLSYITPVSMDFIHQLHLCLLSVTEETGRHLILNYLTVKVHHVSHVKSISI